MEEQTVWGQNAAIHIRKIDTIANKTLREVEKCLCQSIWRYTGRKVICTYIWFVLLYLILWVNEYALLHYPLVMSIMAIRIILENQQAVKNVNRKILKGQKSHFLIFVNEVMTSEF